MLAEARHYKDRAGLTYVPDEVVVCLLQSLRQTARLSRQASVFAVRKPLPWAGVFCCRGGWTR
jgi:hypothetical protein